MIIQLFVTLVCVLILFKAFGVYRKKEVRFFTFFIWSLFWILAIILVWQPDLTNYLARFLQVTRGVDAVFYLAFTLLFYLIFRLMVRIERLDQEITSLVKDLALLERKVHDSNKRNSL